MSLRVAFRARARAELLDAQRWYEARAVGLGRDFAEAVEHAVVRIVDHPDVFPLVVDEIRRAELTRFPYAVFYRQFADRIEVLACLHHRRGPHRWPTRSA